MAVLKVACPKCGQKVSGDESFYGTTVDCPVCSSVIRFPEHPNPNRATPPGPVAGAGVGASPVDLASVPTLPMGEPVQRSAEALPAYQRPEPMKAAASPMPMSQPSPAARPQAHRHDEEPPSPVLGVVSMVLGIVSVAMFCLPGFLFGPAAIISGHLALSRARQSRMRPVPGRGAAITGLILGYLSLAGFILAIVFLPGLVNWVRESKPPQ